MALRASCTVGMRHGRLLFPFPFPSDLITIPDPSIPALKFPNATSCLQSTIIGIIFCSAGDMCNFCSEAFALSIDSAVLTERSCDSMAVDPTCPGVEESLEECEAAIGLVGATPEFNRYFEMVSKLNL